mmetsp:Transcript_9225/g.23371  ORF Transcript_9225/g.23371 Transcript_9225/m.23371 type:complete len:421 (-) Transcript_9225:287-1549(-)
MGIIHGCYVHAMSRPTPTGLHGCCCGAATSHVVLPVPVVDAHVLPLARGVDPGGRPLGAAQLLRHPAHRLPRDLPEALPADALHVDVRQLDAAGLQACAVQHAVGHQQPAAVLRHGGVVVLHVVVRARLHLGQQPPVAALVAADGDLQLVAHAARVLRVVRDRQPAVAQRQRVGLGVGVGQPGAHRRAPAPPVVTRCGRKEAAERGAEVLQHISVGERGHAALDEPARGVRGDAAGRGKGAAVGGGAVLPADQHGGDAEAHAGRLLPDGQHPGPVVQHLQPVGRHLGVAVHVLRAPYDSGWAPHRGIAVKVSGGAVRDVAAGGVVHGGDAVEEPQPARRALVVQHRPPQRRHAGQRAHGARPRAPAVGRARQVQALHQAQPRQRLALVAVPSLPACHQAPPWQTGQHGHMGVAQRGVAFP